MPSLLLCWVLTAVGEPLPRVASTNLCADLVLLSVAAPEQVVSVSQAGRDPRLSPLAEQAQPYPPNRGQVEELLQLRPDLALVYQGWAGRRHSDLLATRGIRVVALPYPKDWTDALATMREVAGLVGRPEQGERKAAEAARRMESFAASSPPLRVLYLRPSGGTAGTGTYVDDLLRLLGLRNLAAEQGHAGWGRLPLEQLILTPPDLFLLGYFDQARTPTRSAYGRHPLMRALLERTPAIRLPGNVWGCGGLELVEVAERILAGIDRLAGSRP